MCDQRASPSDSRRDKIIISLKKTDAARKIWPGLTSSTLPFSSLIAAFIAGFLDELPLQGLRDSMGAVTHPQLIEDISDFPLYG